MGLFSLIGTVVKIPLKILDIGADAAEVVVAPVEKVVDEIKKVADSAVKDAKDAMK